MHTCSDSSDSSCTPNCFADPTPDEVVDKFRTGQIEAAELLDQLEAIDADPFYVRLALAT